MIVSHVTFLASNNLQLKDFLNQRVVLCLVSVEGFVFEHSLHIALSSTT